MALSLRTVAQSCLGLTPPFSVNSDVYGYIFRGTDGSLFGPLVASDILPGTNTQTERSLTRHLQTISGRATDMVPIFVGFVNGFSGGAFSLDDALKVQYAIQVMRDIYAQQNFGVRRINWQHIPQADVGGYADLTDRAEAEDLTDDWSGPAGGIDVFFVQSLGDAGGWSNVEGPCDKNSSDDLTGAVLVISGGRRGTGILLAHEFAHYLGLEHATTITNVMGVDSNGDGIGELDNTSTGLTAAQGTDMSDHCSTSGPC
jgi:hypothetical protein